jgi:hypothetical protein
MTNDQMKPNRFLRWHRARQTARKITIHFARGGKVLVGTYTRATIYNRKHIDLFRATQSGLLFKCGKNWNCIDYAAIRFL